MVKRMQRWAAGAAFAALALGLGPALNARDARAQFAYDAPFVPSPQVVVDEMLRLRPVLETLKPGTRIVAHDFSLGEWRPDRQTRIRKNVYLWIVPARVAGAWQLKIDAPGGGREFAIELRQKFQEIDGVARAGDQIPQPVWEAALAGDQVRFVLVDGADREHETSWYFEGRVAGDVMDGEYRRGVGDLRTRGRWRAARRGS